MNYCTLFISLLILVSACSQKTNCVTDPNDSVNIDNLELVTVLKDCTGVYLRYDSKDYHICNSEIVKKHDNGEEILASFKKVNNCKLKENEIICMMYHENEGWVIVTEIE